MKEEFGSDFITITDEEGNQFELEHLDTVEQDGEIYMAFLPADMDEDAEGYGIILLKVEQDGAEEYLSAIEDEAEEERIYAVFMERLFEEED